MSEQLKASVRDRVGKGAARELRREGLIPAVIYGDKKAPLSIAMSAKDVTLKIRSGGFLSHIIEVDVDGDKHKVIPRDYQLDPVRDFVVHVDFLRIGGYQEKTVRKVIGTPVNVQKKGHFPAYRDWPEADKAKLKKVAPRAAAYHYDLD